jgi:SAM-dependent methyltransferase
VSDVEKGAILQGHLLAGRPQKALEVGCEGGRWSEMLSELGWKMTCTDVDRDNLLLCQRRLPDARCILADPADRSFACESRSLSLLLCIEVPPVINSDWFLSEANRVLTDGGVVVGIFWNLLSWRSVLVRAKSALFGGKEFYKQTWAAWKQELHANGFELISEEGFCWAPFSRESNSRLVPAFTKAERTLRLNRLTTFSPWIAFVMRKAMSPKTPANKTALLSDTIEPVSAGRKL